MNRKRIKGLAHIPLLFVMFAFIMVSGGILVYEEYGPIYEPLTSDPNFCLKNPNHPLCPESGAGVAVTGKTVVTPPPGGGDEPGDDPGEVEPPPPPPPPDDPGEVEPPDDPPPPPGKKCKTPVIDRIEKRCKKDLGKLKDRICKRRGKIKDKLDKHGLGRCGSCGKKDPGRP